MQAPGTLCIKLKITETARKREREKDCVTVLKIVYICNYIIYCVIFTPHCTRYSYMHSPHQCLSFFLHILLNYAVIFLFTVLYLFIF